MGMYDSFYDEDSKCPKCNAKIDEWQTKHLQRLLGRWRRGGFLQYRKLERIPEEERKKKYGNSPWPMFRSTKEYLTDMPLLFNGKVPVHTSCPKCKTWLEAYAKILNGRFTRIIEIEADGEDKELVLIKEDTTARALRDEFDRRLRHLQESCKHEKTSWMDIGIVPLHPSVRSLVCRRCEKTLETKAPEAAQERSLSWREQRTQSKSRENSSKSTPTRKKRPQNHPIRGPEA